jgi:hypothetical protein
VLIESTIDDQDEEDKAGPEGRIDQGRGEDAGPDNDASIPFTERTGLYVASSYASSAS